MVESVVVAIMGADTTDDHHNESDSNDDEATRSHKRNDRLEQNRISARNSRKRKKNLIEELQRTVITLSRENKELMERNEVLRRELMDLGTKHPGVVRSYLRFMYKLYYSHSPSPSPPHNSYSTVEYRSIDKLQ